MQVFGAYGVHGVAVCVVVRDVRRRFLLRRVYGLLDDGALLLRDHDDDVVQLRGFVSASSPSTVAVSGGFLRVLQERLFEKRVEFRVVQVGKLFPEGVVIVRPHVAQSVVEES